MKAIQIDQFSDDGSSVRLSDVELPEPGHGEVRVRMLYAAVNPSDWNYIRGDYHQALERLIWNRPEYRANEQPAFDPDRKKVHAGFPYTLGGEGVGIVEACGGGLLARRLQGKRVAVFAGPPSGSWQECTVVDAKQAVPLDDSVDDHQAAMYMVNPLSALAMVKHVLRVHRGGTVLLSAGGSSLSKTVVRMGKYYEFKTLCIVRNNRHSDALKRLGADAVIETDQVDIQSAVAEITAGRGVDYAMDCIGGETLDAMQSCLTLNGHLLVYGTLASHTAQLFSRDLMTPNAHISGFFAGNWMAGKSLLKKLSLLRELKKLTKAGVFEKPISGIYGLTEYKQALQASSEAQEGKILLRCGA